MTPADRAKAEKLFRMLQSPNENERSVANRKLIELLARYNMTISDLPRLIAQGLDGGTPQPRPPPPPQPPPISIPQQHIDLLVEYLVAGLERDWGIDLRPNIIAMGRLKQAAEEAIYKLLSATSTRIHLPFIARNNMGGRMDLMFWLTQAEFQKLIANPPPPKSPPPPPPPQNTWQPRRRERVRLARAPTLTKAGKVALAFLAFFFLGGPGLYGVGAILNGEPEFGGGVILMVSGITWAIWKFALSKVAEGFVGGGVAVIGLVLLINLQDQQPIHQGKPPPKHAADISVGVVNGLQVISVTGEIGPNDYERFKQRADLLNAKTVVLLSGPGGAASSGYAIGSYIRAKRLATFVSGFCANACADIWLAGSPRFMAPNASIGFHSASDGNGRDSNTGNAVLGAYLNELGLSVNAIAWATTAGPDDITYLRPQNARQLGIDITVRPDLRSVALALEEQEPVRNLNFPWVFR